MKANKHPMTPQEMGRKGGLRRTRKKVAACRANMMILNARKRLEKLQLELSLK
jgi:hypothetical protein